MYFKRLLFSLLLSILACVLVITPALAFPPLPSSFYGQVRVNAQNVPDGTLVQALIGGKVYAEAKTLTYQGVSVYQLTVPGDDSSTTDIEGGREGDTVQFEVGGTIADQTGVWHGGTNLNLDLSAETTAPLPTQQPTTQPTSQPTQLPNPTETAAATRVPPTAANPTLPVPTVTAAQQVVSTTAPSTGLFPTSGSASVSTAPSLPTQVPSQTNQAAGTQSVPQPTTPSRPTQVAASGETLTAPNASVSGDGGTSSGSISPGLLVAAVIGVGLLGGAAWLLPRRKK